MIKLIIFDYDGVIVDSFPIYHQIYKEVLPKFNKEWPESIDEFRKIYGNNSNDLYDHLGLSEEERSEVTKMVKEQLPSHEPKLFDGITDVIKKLASEYKIGVISSSPQEEIERKLKSFGLYDNFEFVIGRPKEQLERFVKTEKMKEVVTNLGIKLDEVLSIGDRNVDYIEGTAAGLKNILLVEYGWGYNKDDIPDYHHSAIINEPKDLLSVLEK